MFTDEEIQHLLWLIDTNKENDEFYGNRKAYWKRAGDIRQKIAGTPVCPSCGAKFFDPTWRPFCSQQCQTEFR